MNNQIKRGDILLINFGEDKQGSEQSGTRPAVVIQNDVGNKFSPTLIVAAITSQGNKRSMPTHIILDKDYYKTPKVCTVLTEQIITIDKGRIIGNKLFSLNELDLARLDRAMMISMGLIQPRPANNIKISKRTDVIAM